MNDEIFKKLQQFVVKERWKYDFPLTRNTTLQRDLGIYGDDSDEFILAFGKEFNVDVSQFPIGDYFKDEGDMILPSLIRFFTNRKKTEKKIITLGQLEKAIYKGKLDEYSIL